MVLALRLPLLEGPLGGMDRVYRLHKWAGIGAALAAIVLGRQRRQRHPQSPVGRAGRRRPKSCWPGSPTCAAPPKTSVNGRFTCWAMVASLCSHVAGLPPLARAAPRHAADLPGPGPAQRGAAAPSLMAAPLGWLMGGLIALGSLARCGRWRCGWGCATHTTGRIYSVRVLGSGGARPIEVICALPSSWPGHRSGQFAFVR